MQEILIPVLVKHTERRNAEVTLLEPPHISCTPHTPHLRNRLLHGNGDTRLTLGSTEVMHHQACSAASTCENSSHQEEGDEDQDAD